MQMKIVYFWIKIRIWFCVWGRKKAAFPTRKRIASKTQGKAFKDSASRELLEGVFEK